MKVNNRIIGLDLFRGFCGYGVAVCHLEAFLYSNIHFEYLSLLFVEFFFVLSGFVLYPQLTLLIDNKKNLLIFYKRRWLRTLPLYITFLILASILFGQLFSLNFLKYLFFIQKLFPHFLSSHYYPIAWSLSIEEFFYLLAPLLLIFSNRKNFLARIVIVFAIILLIKLLVADHVDSNFFRTGTILRLDSILVGFIFRHFFSFFYKIKYFFIVLLL